MPKVAVCLSGCGFLDGAEIHESVLTLLALDQAGAQVVCCAPDRPQAKVVDHATQTSTQEKRNVLTESARIARGEIKPLSTVSATDVDALILPGGFGAALNLSTFAAQGSDCKVDPDVETFINDMFEMKKPIGAICIAPVILARILGGKGIAASLTIGSDTVTANAITKMGAAHRRCDVTEMHVDRKHKIVTTPAYMLGKGPAEVFEGIRKCVAEVLKLID